MKKFTILMLFCLSIFGQEYDPEGWQHFEIFVGTYAPSGNFSYMMEAKSTVWKGGPHAGDPYSITNEIKYLLSRYPLTGYVGPTIFPDYGTWEGYDFVYNSWLPGIKSGYGYGLYKISIESGGNAYFYIDYRDNNIYYYSNYPCTPTDIWLKYDSINDQFYYVNCGSYALDPLSHEWNYIQSGDYLTIWNIKLQNSVRTDDFPDYWQNCLALIENSNGNYNYPRLVWGPHPTFTTTNFKVYRAVTDRPRNPLSLTYTLIHTTAENETFDYTDLNIRLGSSSDYIYYYVKAHNNGSYSGRTNYVSSYGEYAPEKLVVEPNAAYTNLTISEFKLYNTYPNPFNPITTISFNLPEESFVNLVVYNIQGEKVATLVNEQLSEGSYDAQFNAANLPSGIYIYKITAGSISQIKRMLFIK